MKSNFEEDPMENSSSDEGENRSDSDKTYKTSSPLGQGAEALETSMSTSSSCSSGECEDREIKTEKEHEDWYVCSGSEVESSLQLSVSSDSSLPEIKTTVHIPEMITWSNVTLYKVNIESTDICFHTPSSCVFRSYSDFVWLRKRIMSSCSFMKRSIPDLPSRYNLLNLFDKDFGETRRLGLQEFLRQVLEDRSFLSDAALHLFLQSNLHTSQIQDWLEGKMDVSVLELVRRCKGVLPSPDCSIQDITS